MLIGLAPHDLTMLPEVFGVGIGLGLVLGGIIGFFWRADTDSAMVQSIVAGGTLGSIAGAILALAVSLAAIAAGA